MTELLEVYDLNDTSLGPQERKEFYAEIQKEYAETGRVTRKVKTVHIVILSPEGRIYLQKRSNSKLENAGLYDKTIGGHIAFGESPTVTVVRECAEELGFPVVALPAEEFASAAKSTDLTIIGILHQVGVDKNFISIRKTDAGEGYKKLDICHFYIGYYDGAMKFKDGESSGLETFSLKELKEELVKNPQKFTEDLRAMVNEFAEYLKPL